MTDRTKSLVHPPHPSAAIAALWLAFFLLALAIPCWLLARHGVESDVFTSGMEEISGIYAPHIGAILAFYLASRSIRRRKPATSRLAFVLAVLVSIAWNLIAVGILSQVLWGSTGLEDASKLAGDISRKLSWVVAPVIGYFFASEAKAASKP
jgi:hypothetical protein